MRNIKLYIQYDGTRYKGWQRLKDTDNTIQKKIEDVLSRMTSQPILITGSGRTDMGVHANGQVANFHTNSKMHIKEIMEYCNTYLPEDIGIVDIEEVDERFHSRYNAKKKTYTYHIFNSNRPRVFDRKYIYRVEEKLNINKMKQAVKLLVGEHDFKGFTAMKSKKKSTVRTIFYINIEVENDYIKIVYCGDGFLHKMIRILTGTLIEVGSNKMQIEDVEDILQKGVRADAGITVPSKGLFLDSVEY